MSLLLYIYIPGTWKSLEKQGLSKKPGSWIKRPTFQERDVIWQKVRNLTWAYIHVIRWQQYAPGTL